MTKTTAKKSPKKAAKKSEAGRPTKYKKIYDEQAYKLTLLGGVDSELADFFNVTESTLNKWKIDHPLFSESIKNGKDIANANVATSMYQKSIGYSHPEDKIFSGGYDENGKPRDPLIVGTTKHYPPDTMAASLFLRNRSRVKGAIGLNWQDKTEQEVTNTHKLASLSDEDLDRMLQQRERDLEQSTKD